MYTNAKITHYAKDDYARQTYDVYLERSDNGKSTKEGDVKSHALFVSVPTTKEIGFAVGDFIVDEETTDALDKSSEQNESGSLRRLKSNHRVYTISTMKPCLYGSKTMWHYELECD